jgi:hypothetical protein
MTWMNPQWRRRLLALAPVAAVLGLAAPAHAVDLLANVVPGAKTELTVKMQILIIMTLLGLLPVMVMMMTSFTRFVIVLSLLRQALGLQQGLPNRVITGVALILTLLVMRPIGNQIWTTAFVPYDQDKIGLETALQIAEKPISRFMLAQTSKAALQQIAHLAGEDKITEPRSTLHRQAGGVCAVRTEDRVPDRLHAVHPVPGDRPGGVLGADGDGYDDAVAAGDFAAVQAAAVRAGGRLDPDREYAGDQRAGLLRRRIHADP